MSRFVSTEFVNDLSVATRRRKTVACPDCDVTWRGTLDDECWSCGQAGITITAKPMAVKIVAVPAAS